MSNVGFGIGAAVGIASETTEGTPVSPSVSLPFTSESIGSNRPVVKTGTITGDRSHSKMLDGVRSGQGDISMELDGSNASLLTYYANGKASGALTSANIPGRLATIAGAAAAGGSLTAGAYKYKACSVWQRTDTGEKFLLPCSNEITVTTETTNLTAALTWTSPHAAVPTGFTYYGTAIYRSAAGGAADSETFRAFVSGNTALYNDTAVGTLGTSIPIVPASAMRQHIFVKAFTTGAHPLQAFTTTVNKDNNKALQFLLCRCANMEYTIGENGSVVTAKFGVLARDWRTTTNFSPSVTNLRKMMSWGVTVRIDGTFDETVRGATFQVNNNAALRPGLSGLPRMLDVGYGMRDISGTLPRSYNDQNFVDKLYDAERFSIQAWAIGQGVVTDALAECEIESGVFAKPIPYMMCVDVPLAAINKAGANASGPGEMVEALEWMAELDPTTGTDIKITHYNLTNTYA